LPGIEESDFYMFNVSPGKYVIEIYIDEKGFIEKLIINGKEIPPGGTIKYISSCYPPRGAKTFYFLIMNLTTKSS